MLSSVKTATIAGIAAVAVAIQPLPALALGKKERGFIAGAATVLLLEELVRHGRERPAPRPLPHRYDPPPPVYDPPPRCTTCGGGGYHRHERVSPAAAAFNNYPYRDRIAIQRALWRLGYYRGAIDGAFGPATNTAVAAYARDCRLSLRSVESSYAVYDSLLY